MASDEDQKTFVRTWGITGRKNKNAIDTPNSIAISSNGNVYVVSSQLRHVVCFDSYGNFIMKWGQQGPGNGEFQWPSGVTIGTNHGRSTALLSAITSIVELASFPPGLLPICMEYIGVESVYVVDYKQHQIQVFEMDGKYIRKWGSDGKEKLKFPWGIVQSPMNGYLYITEVQHNRVRWFDCDGKSIGRWGDRSQFEHPRGISISRDGMIYITDLDSDRIVILNHHLNGTTTAYHWQMEKNFFPFGVMVDDDTHSVWVTGQSHIRQYGKDGTLIREVGKRGTKDGEFQHPVAIAKGPDDHLMYIVDRGNNRIVVM